MKIVYFNYLYDLYEGAIGSTIKAQKLLRALADQGAEVKDYWLNAKPPRENNGESVPVRRGVKARLSRYLHEISQILKNINYYRREKEIIKREKPDLVISRHGGYMLSTVILAKTYRFPFIMEIDSPEAYENRQFYSDKYFMLPGLVEAIERLNYRLSPFSFVQSDVLKKYVLDRAVPERTIRVIPNAADPPGKDSGAGSGEIKKKYNLHGSIVVGFVGSFHYWHGIENLIYLIDRTLKKLQPAGSIKFLLVGSGGVKEPELKKFIIDNRYQNLVIMTGLVKQAEVSRYIQAMDIVVAPYPRLEFFYYSPVKIYEYMAQGKAILASRIGQIAELIENGRNGILCDPDDRDEMVQSLIRLVQDGNLRKKLGRAALSDCRNKHQWTNRGEELFQFCNEVVNKNDRI